MSFEVNISREAENDLRGIFEYIAYGLRSVQNAVSQLAQLEENIRSLSYMPDRFRLYDKEPWQGRGLRIMPVDNYLVFYIPYHETHTVNIVRVMYGGRDIDIQMNRFAQE